MSERIPIIAPYWMKVILKEAASLEGESLSQFLRSAGLEKARKVIAEAEKVKENNNFFCS